MSGPDGPQVTTRWRLVVEYDGTDFVGWQRQANGPSVQAALEDAILRLSGEEVVVKGAGRTDTGVHATGQVAHFDLVRHLGAKSVRDGINFHLPTDAVTVLEAAEAEPGFDARFSARGRAYLYRILNRRTRPALDRGRVWHVGRHLDVDRMAEAARVFVGRHDFTSFRSAQCQSRTAVKTLDRLDVVRAGDEVHVVAEARSFLHNQVRILVGTLERVGAGRWSVNDVCRALEARDRAAGGPTAPAHGLYLTRVWY